MNLARLIRIVAITVATLSTFFPYANALEFGTLSKAIHAEEVRLGARIGMAVFDAKDGTRWAHRGDERFPLNSTHKSFTCAALLKQVDRRVLALEHQISVERASLVTYSPVIEKAGGQVSLREACAASVSWSDNTAANIVTDAIGGTQALTAFMRDIGDPHTRLDRKEPEMNEATPNDLRDTTTPNAIVESLRRIILGEVLRQDSRALLTGWMKNDKVADVLLRASLPRTWSIADKSGAGGHGSRSIVAVIWPENREPVVVGIYITQTVAPMVDSNAAIARVGSVLVDVIRR
jgi:beta-lactamase class A